MTTADARIVNICIHKKLTPLVMATCHTCQLLSHKSTAAQVVPWLILVTSILSFDLLLISKHHDLVTSRFAQ